MKSRSMEEHRKTSPKKVKIGIITLSDSKYQDFLDSKDTDVSGSILKDTLSKEHQIVSYQVIPDESENLISAVEDMKGKGVEVIITTGGTGIGNRDITIETLKPLYKKELNGFGEIFRYESYLELGSGAILSRATAGIYKNMIIFSLPGSPNAVKMGLKIIKEELGHLVRHLKE
jgi:molybdenum cofactor biosynthesis protein B